MKIKLLTASDHRGISMNNAPCSQPVNNNNAILFKTHLTIFNGFNFPPKAIKCNAKAQKNGWFRKFHELQ